jgi:hypothetical protein
MSLFGDACAGGLPGRKGLQVRVPVKVLRLLAVGGRPPGIGLHQRAQLREYEPFWGCEWQIPKATIASTAEDALAILSQGSFDFCFLDHDLCFNDAAFPDRPGSGERVAHYLAQKGFVGRTVIHSVNEIGAIRMKARLHQAQIAPFGTFEVSVGR